eukprot:1742363-Rhodomonas_salina.1
MVAACQLNPRLVPGGTCHGDSPMLLAGRDTVWSHAAWTVWILAGDAPPHVLLGTTTGTGPVAVHRGGRKKLEDMSLGTVNGLYWVSERKVVLVDSTPLQVRIRIMDAVAEHGTIMDVMEGAHYARVTASALGTLDTLLYLYDEFQRHILVCDLIFTGSCAPQLKPKFSGMVHSLVVLPGAGTRLLACTSTGISEVRPDGHSQIFATSGNCTFAGSRSDNWLAVADTNALFLFDYNSREVLEILAHSSKTLTGAYLLENRDSIAPEASFTPYVSSVTISPDTSQVYFITGPATIHRPALLRRVQVGTSACPYAANVSLNINSSTQC